ncbi:hypothetical protein [Streptacidiphilus albus]|uniref:hypothetical protein n=1 Tax=Streptacidiphilus albus TaxID=105425 RepID=UPI000B1AFE3A|nr:hypothetical protein [Streptacidiphilus albus]
MPVDLPPPSVGGPPKLVAAIWFDKRVLLGIPAGTGLTPEAFRPGDAVAGQ